jgi:predicted  nucleic acid-binding Zn-ribbon protein
MAKTTHERELNRLDKEAADARQEAERLSEERAKVADRLATAEAQVSDVAERLEAARNELSEAEEQAAQNYFDGGGTVDTSKHTRRVADLESELRIASRGRDKIAEQLEGIDQKLYDAHQRSQVAHARYWRRVFAARWADLLRAVDEAKEAGCTFGEGADKLPYTNIPLARGYFWLRNTDHGDLAEGLTE